MPQRLLEIRGLTKTYGGNHALADVDFDLCSGEIHALLGENGAGKSTLIKVLAGVVQRDAGDIDVLGVQLTNPLSPRQAREAGIAFVHQDLGLVDSMSVAENVALITGYQRRRGFISHQRTVAAAADLLQRYDIDIDPSCPVGQLDQDQKVMVAVARALALSAGIIVLDEVSSSLPSPEMERLSRSLIQSRDRGAAYVYVTHRLEEIFRLADRVTVLRDGRVRATSVVADTTHQQVVNWIVGSAIEVAATRTAARPVAAAPYVRASDLTGPGLHEPISFTIARGEVLAVCGLTGSGPRALAGLVAGAVRGTGVVELDGRTIRLGQRAEAMRHGVAYVPGDRQTEGGVATLSVRENLHLRRGRTPQSSDPWRLIPRAERRGTASQLETLGVRPRDASELRLNALSGGNQQKVILGRALRTSPQLLVLDDPTVGVDVGARRDLHTLIRTAAEKGTSVLLASTDFEEVASQADRVLIMAAGRIVSELCGTDITLERLSSLSYQSSASPPSEPESDGDPHHADTRASWPDPSDLSRTTP